MENSSQYIDRALSYINQLMLSYSLHNTEQIKDKDSEEDAARVQETLEESIRAEPIIEDGVLSTVSVWKVFKEVQEHIDDALVLDYRIDTLRKLKEKVIGYQQEFLLKRVKALTDPLAGLCGKVAAETEAEKAFPLEKTANTHDERAKKLEKFQKLVKEGGPDELKLYFDDITRLIFDGHDIRGGYEMLQTLNKEMFFWSVSTSAMEPDETDPKKPGVNTLRKRLEGQFGEYRYGYGKLMLELEEVKTRLSNIKIHQRALLVQLFQNDYGENMAPEDERLRDLGEEIGSPDLLDRIKKGDFLISNILKQVASQGPAHLDMTINHIDSYIRKIKKDVFNQEEDTHGDSKDTRYLVIREPRRFLTGKDDIQENCGILPAEFDGMNDEIFGLLTTYTVISWPPERYSGPLPKKAKAYGRDIYRGDRFTVADFYAEMLDAPEQVVEAYLEGERTDSLEFRMLAQSSQLPKGGYQLLVPSDVLLGKDLSVIVKGRRMQVVDGRSVQVYELERLYEGSGAHNKMNLIVAENPQSEMLSREEFEKRIRSGQLF